MLSVLIVCEEPHRYRELEECLLNDFHVEFADRLSSNLSELSRIEFSFEVIFYLKPIDYSELPAVARLLKRKVFVLRIFSENNVPIKIDKLVPVADSLLLRASAMRGRIEYYRGVDVIAIRDAMHMDCEGEVVLNGEMGTKALLGDIIFRRGKNVVFGVRRDSIAVFSADVFSNDAMKQGDNCKFIKNLVNSMLGSAELY